jgi:hypothetical protein
MKIFIIFTLPQILLKDEIREDEMGEAWERGDAYRKFGKENVKEEFCFENVGIDGKIILEWIL